MALKAIGLDDRALWDRKWRVMGGEISQRLDVFAMIG